MHLVEKRAECLGDIREILRLEVHLFRLGRVDNYLSMEVLGLVCMSAVVWAR